MKHWRWLSLCLLIALGANAQQADPPAAQSPQPAAMQPVSTTPGIALQQQSAARAPVSMDEVVDRILEREHALMNFLKDRQPLVETYLQNLAPDSKVGAVPK